MIKSVESDSYFDGSRNRQWADGCTVYPIKLTAAVVAPVAGVLGPLRVLATISVKKGEKAKNMALFDFDGISRGTLVRSCDLK